MRGYGENVMAQRNISEEMDDEVVNMLLDEVEKSYSIYARFLKAKAKMLGLDSDFSVWDIGAPLGKSDKDFTFEEAYDLHLSVMKEFDADFYEYSQKMIEEERIDVFPHAGKRG
jgi:oligoendopeptidase F